MTKLPWWNLPARGFSRLPFFVLYAFSNGIRLVLIHVLGYRKSVVDDNIQRAFPEKSSSERREIRSGFYKNLTDIMVESIKSLTISSVQLRKRVILHDRELFVRLKAENRGVMLVMGHQTNFEWVALAMPLLVPQKTFAVYGRVKNPKVNRFIVNMRQRFGLTLFQMKDTYDFMLSQKEKAPLYIFMADQAPHKGKIKYRAPFFNIPTPTHLGVENLAKKCDLAVVFIQVKRIKRGHYEITPRLLFEHPKNTETHEITNAHVGALEEMIRESPADWLWSHKRWKNL
ncbi:MAG: lysophospholipid acyltransferase family protein [Cryomorphaceae bacterium]|nr:lysophospholipid acyltransferase family protein [Cryomorphaceae bacterium]